MDAGLRDRSTTFLTLCGRRWAIFHSLPRIWERLLPKWNNCATLFRCQECVSCSSVLGIRERIFTYPTDSNQTPLFIPAPTTTTQPWAGGRAAPRPRRGRQLNATFRRILTAFIGPLFVLLLHLSPTCA